MFIAESMSKAAMRPSSSRERWVAFGVGLGLAFVATVGAGWSSIGQVGVPFSITFFAAYSTALALCSLFAAMLLLFRARLVCDSASALVAAAFVFVVPLTAAYALTFPGIGPHWTSYPEASGWASFGWRIGWPVAIAWYALRRSSSRTGLVRSAAVALFAAVAIVVLAGSGALPSLYIPDSTTFLPLVHVLNWIEVAIGSVALVCVVRLKPLTTLDVWLAVALVMLVTSSALICLSSSRLSDVNDVARLLRLAWSAIIVCALVSEFQRLLARSASLDRFMMMAESAATVVFLFDAQGSCIHVNRRWTNLTGQAAGKALGNGWTEVIHPGDLDATASIWRPAVAMGHEYEIEVRYRCADGTYRWHLATSTPTYDADERLTGWYASATDIDVQHRALVRLEELYAREHTTARTLQSAFVPVFLPQVDGLRFEGVYRPAVRETELGGDWYDAFVLGDGRIALSIGDVAGHGIDAAVAMVRLRETLRAATGFIDSDPALILQMADRAFFATGPNVFATAAVAIYDPLTRRLVYARAGHPAAALVRDGSATLLNSNAGVPLGVQPDSTFVSQTFVLEPGDTLVLYTDGLLEMDRNIVAGEQRLIRLLERHSGDAESLVNETLADRQRDDVALLKLSVVQPADQSSWHFESDDAGSAADARFAFSSHLRRRASSAELLEKAELVFGELVGNVVRHAPGPIEIELLWRDGEPFLIVRDRGPQFDIGDFSLPRDPLAEGGRGMFLIRCYASEPVVTRRFGGGNEVVVALSAPNPEAFAAPFAELGAA